MFSTLTDNERLLIIILLLRQIHLLQTNIPEWFNNTRQAVLPHSARIPKAKIYGLLDKLCQDGILKCDYYHYSEKAYTLSRDSLPMAFLCEIVKDPLWQPCFDYIQDDISHGKKYYSNYYYGIGCSDAQIYTNNLLFDSCFRNDTSNYFTVISKLKSCKTLEKEDKPENILQRCMVMFWKTILNYQVDDALLNMHPYFQLLYASAMIECLFFDKQSMPFPKLMDIFDILTAISPEIKKKIPLYVLENLMAWAIFCGKTDELEKIHLQRPDVLPQTLCSAMQAVACGDWKNATNVFAKLFKDIQSAPRTCGLLYLFVMFWSEVHSGQSVTRCKALSSMIREHAYNKNSSLDLILWDYAKTHGLQKIFLDDSKNYSYEDLLILSQLFAAVPTLKQQNDLCQLLQQAMQNFSDQGIVWPAAMIARGLLTAFPSDKSYAQQWHKLSAEAHLDYMQTSVNNWDALMHSLNTIFKGNQEEPTTPNKILPIAWFIITNEDDTSDYLYIKSIEAYRLKTTSDNKVSFYATPINFIKAASQDCFSETDAKLFRELAPLSDSYKHTIIDSYYLTDAILTMLCQADYIYRHYTTYSRKDRYDYGKYIEHTDRITLQKQKITIQADTHTDGSLKLSLPGYPHTGSAFLKLIQPGQYALVFLDEQTRNFRFFLQEYGSEESITIPAEAASQYQPLFNIIGAKYTISGKLGKQTLANLETIPSENNFVLRIEQLQEGFTLALFAKPCSKATLLLPPGAGKPQCSTEIDGKVVWLQRNLKKEKQQVKVFLDTFSELNRWNAGDDSWLIENLDDSLAFLEHFKADAPNFMTLEWNRKKPVKVAKCNSWKDITLHSGFTADQWFSMGADIQLDDTTISLAELLQAVQTASTNFVKIDDDTYMELTTSLRKQLQAMATLAKKIAKSDDVELPPAALPMLAGILDDDTLPQNLLEVVHTIKKALASKPKVPKGITADLRDYQIDGFKWLRRLADCRIGCCLADDMGIGKTLQAISLLLDIATRGPSLVITPASLGLHWYNECAHFAPQLNAILFPTDSEERQRIVQDAKSFDLVICTYGVLMTEGKLLGSRSWNCLILDEAQAIKNKDAKRAKTAKLIPADFRIALTGTPVENNLLELWSLFDFLNHGMLGSEDNFKQRYVDNETQNCTPALKRAVSPLILRRRKEEVLEELPAKTEITVDVELSAIERALYESLRQKALKALQSTDSTKLRFQILTHLMTLREFCCHPELAKCNFKNDSAKMTALMELAQTLKDAGHRTLIFSQFVGFLSLIKSIFDKQGFSYSYLDGSTPAKERQKLVDEFNHGTNDFFLISLRAGGLGLNLTSADFVIILDPWWNPAVENQAADRVYRIGQTKPVTVYRLVCKDTVEQRVLELQTKKSDLVREIFEDQSAPALKLDELMNLLQ